MTLHQKSIEQKFRKLTDVEHVLLRPGRYIGSVKPHTALTWVIDGEKMAHKEVTWNPGFLKLFDEIITNSVDHSKRPEGKHLDTIKVEVDRAAGTISVWDNGGMPVVKHKEYNEYVPTIVLGYLRAGSNFDDNDESDLTGQNGEGASLSNVFSTKFVVETCDGHKRFKQTWTKNMMEASKPSIIEIDDEKGFTKVTYTPDYAHLGTTLDDGNFAKITKRVYDIAGCNSHLKIYIDGKRIRIDSFKDYVKLYTDKFEYDDESPDWQVAITASEDGFRQVSFVNSTAASQGGTHVDYVMDQIVDDVRAYIKKKYKSDIKPNEIKAQMRVFINARIINPRYDSQTKENLITEPKDFKTKYKASEKFIQRILRSDIIQNIIEWMEAKAAARAMAEEREKAKEISKADPRRILKLEDAALAGKKPEQCYLFITEGDSAAKTIISSRDPKTQGALGLKGKPQNANSVTVKKLLGMDKEGDARKGEATEFVNMMIGMGLEINTPIKSIKDLRYGHLVITSDADQDGAHVAGLLLSNIHKFWPELFDLGVVYRFFTPIVKVWVKGQKEPISFETEQEYKAWMSVEKNAKTVKESKYYKGLGTSETKDFKVYLANIKDHLVQIKVEDVHDGKLINLVFGKEDGSADMRKHWLDISEDEIFTAEELAAL